MATQKPQEIGIADLKETDALDAPPSRSATSQTQPLAISAPTITAPTTTTKASTPEGGAGLTPSLRGAGEKAKGASIHGEGVCTCTLLCGARTPRRGALDLVSPARWRRATTGWQSEGNRLAPSGKFSFLLGNADVH